MTLTTTADQERGLARIAQRDGFETITTYMQAQLDAHADAGLKMIDAEADEAWKAKRPVYEKADPKATKEAIEAAAQAAKEAAAAADGGE